MPRLVNCLNPIRRQAPLNKGLLRWWLAEPFRAHSLRFWDLTRKSPMTLSGALRLGQRGRVGGFGASVFDGINDYGQTAAIDLSGISTMTVSFWLYWDAYANNDKLALETSATSSSNTGAFFINPNCSSPAIIQIAINTDGTNFSAVNFSRAGVPAARWNHWVVCMNRGAGAQQIAAVYINGASQSLTNSFTDADGGNFGNYAWNFMSRNGTSLFGAGRLDDIRINNRVLAAWEARALMNASRRGYPQELRLSRGLEPLYYVPEEEQEETETFTVLGAGPLGAEEIPNTVLATAQSLQVPAGTKYATVQAVGANFNYFISGATPTTGGTGDGRKLYASGQMAMNCGFTSAKFIRESDVANSRLVVEYFSNSRLERLV